MVNRRTTIVILTKLKFLNVFLSKKVTEDELGTPQGYLVDFKKTLVTMWKIQYFRVSTWNFPKLYYSSMLYSIYIVWRVIQN